MMKLIGVARLGQDAELRRTAGGTAVCNLSLAWNYGRKGDDGKRPSQWVEAALFGERAESLAPHLTKGTSLFVDLRDVHVETYSKRDGGTGTKLVGAVDSLEFAGNRTGDVKDHPYNRKRDPSPEDIERADEEIPF